MFITHLRLHNIRNLRTAELAPARGLNVIVGDNGSGKTSLMEAIFLLGRGRSFRTSHLNEVLTFGEVQLWAFARSEDEKNEFHNVGIEYQRREGISARIDNQRVARLSELAQVVPVLFIGSERSMLLSVPPQERREFLDWGLFHVEPGFLETWRRYNRALSQRNAALRTNRSDQEIKLWDRELSDTATILAALRNQHAYELSTNLKTILPELASFSIEGIEVSLDRGWSTSADVLEDVLQRDLERDRQLGYTRSGPHRSDWELRITEKPARQFCSAGQQKVLVYGLLLAQVKAVAARRRTPVLCLDDLPAELDSKHRKLLLQRLHNYGAQIFASATDESLLETSSSELLSSVFHVEHGTVLTS